MALGSEGRWRIAESADHLDNSDHLLCVPTDDGFVACVQCDDAIRSDTREILTRGAMAPVGGRLQLVIGTTHIEIRDTSKAAPSPRRLEALSAAKFRGLRDTQQGGPAPATLGRWLEALGSMHRNPASQPEFFADAARFVVDPVGLDGALVLRTTSTGQDNWKITSSCLPHPRFGVGFESELVQQAIEQRQTLFHSKHDGGVAVVVSPLTNEVGNVTGVVYGYRATHADNARRSVRYLEAQLVELLAKSVSAGITRLAIEAQAAQQRVSYQRSFAPSVVSQVELDSELLKGAEREVTVLFADLRDSSLLSKQLSTDDTYAILSDVMQALTESVIQHDGTLIDYYGDGLAAMWNAPVEQPQHTLLACRAAQQMQASLNQVSQRWRDKLDHPLKLGVGVHTDLAQVGNIGSSQRIKYGPRGAMVNLTSRLEQFTKQCGTTIAATRRVAQRIGREMLSYRVCRVAFPSVEQPVDVFAIRPPSNDANQLRRIAQYEEALTQFESGNLESAGELLDLIYDGADLSLQFLRDQIAHEHHRRLGRRASDDRHESLLPMVELTG